MICTFEKAPIDKPQARISGYALLTLQQPDRPNIVRMQAHARVARACAFHTPHLACDSCYLHLYFTVKVVACS